MIFHRVSNIGCDRTWWWWWWCWGGGWGGSMRTLWFQKHDGLAFDGSIIWLFLTELTEKNGINDNTWRPAYHAVLTEGPLAKDLNLHSHQVGIAPNLWLGKLVKWRSKVSTVGPPDLDLGRSILLDRPVLDQCAPGAGEGRGHSQLGEVGSFIGWHSEVKGFGDFRFLPSLDNSGPTVHQVWLLLAWFSLETANFPTKLQIKLFLCPLLCSIVPYFHW